jgi:hypothetical protein
MSIRLNLLAESQAAEESRRRDPVKRGVWIGALLVVAMLVWASSLQLKAMLAHSELGRLEGQLQSHTNTYKVVLDHQNKTAEIKQKLEALRLLSGNRLLNGSLLNALQQTTVDDVQLLRLRVEQLYTRFEGTKRRTNDNGTIIPAKPPTATENIVLTLEGMDSSANPGDQLNRYKLALSANPYFQEMLVKTNGINLKNLAPPTVSPLTGKRGVHFTLECRYPEKTR